MVHKNHKASLGEMSINAQQSATYWPCLDVRRVSIALKTD